MVRVERGEGKPDMSAEARSWWEPPRLREEEGGRRDDLEASGVLLRFPMMWLAMAVGVLQRQTIRVERR